VSVIRRERHNAVATKSRNDDDDDVDARELFLNVMVK
jgi:hypothetical protein